MTMWANGYCSAFAEVLKLIFGGELWAVVNHSRKCPDSEDDCLVHAYCVIDGRAYDAIGSETIAEASDVSDVEIPEMDADLDAVIQWRQVDSKWFLACHEDYTNGLCRLKQAIAYIRRKKEIFGHLPEIPLTMERIRNLLTPAGIETEDKEWKKVIR